MIGKILAAAVFLAGNYYIYYHMATGGVIPQRESFAAFPSELGEWTCPRRQSIGTDTEQNLGVSDYLLCDWIRREDSTVVNVYLGYHETQVRNEGGGSGENSIHTPKHCLPGSGWNIIAHDLRPIRFEGIPDLDAIANRLIIAKGNHRQLVYYWYQSRGRVIAEDWKKIVALTWDRGTRQRTDGSLVRFTIPLGRDGEEPAEEAFSEIASAILKDLPRYVPN